MSSTLKGRIDWNLKVDKDGHRDYMVKWLCVTDDTADGPERVFFTPGLPAIGATWAYGNDTDAWAFRWPTASVTPVETKEPGNHWIVEHTFSTKPLSRCQDDSIENPLDEPDRLSGTFVKYTEEATVDRNGDAITSSSHEMIRGPMVEFDSNRPTVSIEKNILALPLSTFTPMIDSVNDATLWGLGARKVKLSNAKWKRVLYGTCTFYFIVTYDLI